MPDWKYGDILRPAPEGLDWLEPGDRLMFLIEAHEDDFGFFAVALSIEAAPDHSAVWLADFANWEIDPDA